MNISEQQLNNMMSAVTTALQPLIRALPVTPVEWADQNYYNSITAPDKGIAGDAS